VRVMSIHCITIRSVAKTIFVSNSDEYRKENKIPL